MRACSMKSLDSSHFSLRRFLLSSVNTFGIQKMMSEIDV